MKRYLLPALLCCAIFSCTKDQTAPPLPANTGFPSDVSAIINTKCSTSGCHTDAAKEAAGGLSMETWDDLLKGGTGGAVAIAYSPDQSWLTYYTNTDTSKGVVLTPTMPYLQAPLSATEWQTLYDWLDAGAPNDQGVIPFSGDPNRDKFYVSNEGCDFVSVFDAESKLCMRCVNVGQIPGPGETPHQIRFSPDGQYWYVVFVNGTIVQKYKTEDDSYVGSIDIGGGYWNTMAITPDGKYGFVIDFDTDGGIAEVDLENMTLIQTFTGLTYPHGSIVDPTGKFLYVTAQYGNYIYKFDITNPLAPILSEVVLVPGQTPIATQGLEDPHEILFSPDGSKYFVTCQQSNEIRVMDAATDTLIKAIPVSQYPLEMSISPSRNLMFVTCEYEPSAEPKTEGAVSIIDLNTMQVIKTLQDELYLPHGVAVLENENYVVIASRNLDSNGPAPHHVSDCGGRDGFVKLIDMNTLDFIPDYRTEVSVDPYSVVARPNQ